MAGLTKDFENGLVGQLDAALTLDVHDFFVAWSKAEGGTATHNPFNTTEPMPKATNYNKVGVKNYPSEQIGILATYLTLTNGFYEPIVDAIKVGKNALDMAQGVANSPWGTGEGVLIQLHAAGYEPSRPPIISPQEDDQMFVGSFPGRNSLLIGVTHPAVQITADEANAYAHVPGVKSVPLTDGEWTSLAYPATPKPTPHP